MRGCVYAYAAWEGGKRAAKLDNAVLSFAPSSALMCECWRWYAAQQARRDARLYDGQRVVGGDIMQGRLVRDFSGWWCWVRCLFFGLRGLRAFFLCGRGRWNLG